MFYIYFHYLCVHFFATEKNIVKTREREREREYKSEDSRKVRYNKFYLLRPKANWTFIE